jgi:hypothetical protein
MPQKPIDLEASSSSEPETKPAPTTKKPPAPAPKKPTPAKRKNVKAESEEQEEVEEEDIKPARKIARQSIAPSAPAAAGKKKPNYLESDSDSDINVKEEKPVVNSRAKPGSKAKPTKKEPSVCPPFLPWAALEEMLTLNTADGCGRGEFRRG